MKINSELERLLQVEQVKAQPKSGNNQKVNSNSFESLLGEEISALNQQEKASNVNHLKALADPMAIETEALANMEGTKDLSHNQNDEKILKSLVQGLQSSLDSMDAYTNSLQGSESLKQAYANLEQANNQIDMMRQDYAKLTTKNPTLNNMLQDLEVMAVTETYKFNRGDYA